MREGRGRCYALGFDGGRSRTLQPSPYPLVSTVTAGRFGLGAPVLLRGELHGDGGEDKEEERRGREVPVPLERRGDEVDHERGEEPGQQEPAFSCAAPTARAALPV